MPRIDFNVFFSSFIFIISFYIWKKSRAIFKILEFTVLLSTSVFISIIHIFFYTSHNILLCCCYCYCCCSRNKTQRIMIVVSKCIFCFLNNLLRSNFYFWIAFQMFQKKYKQYLVLDIGKKQFKNKILKMTLTIRKGDGILFVLFLPCRFFIALCRSETWVFVTFYSYVFLHNHTHKCMLK